MGPQLLFGTFDEFHGRCDIAPVRLARGELGYDDSAIVPGDDWEPVTAEDGEQLRADDSTPDGILIELVRRPLPDFDPDDLESRLEVPASTRSTAAGPPRSWVVWSALATRPPLPRTLPPAAASACTSTTSTGCRTPHVITDVGDSASTSAPDRVTCSSATTTSSKSAARLRQPGAALPPYRGHTPVRRRRTPVALPAHPH